MFWLQRENVPFKQVGFLQGCLCVRVPRCWRPGVPCDHLLRAQFITPVHYSICWALSTWIIESDASIINYIVHVHNPHLRVYSFTVKIHCVGTWHTRSYIENKLIYKYFFFSSPDSIFIKSYIFQWWFLWLLLPQQDHWWKKLSYIFTSSFSFFATNIYGMAVLLTVGGWGWGWVSLISLRRIRGWNAGLVALYIMAYTSCRHSQNKINKHTNCQ